MLARDLVLALSVSAPVGCASSELHIASAAPASSYLTAPSGEPSGAELGAIRFRPSVCEGIDLHPVGRPLEADDFALFAKSQGLETRTVRARYDLVFVDVVNAGTTAPVRFRIAVLSSPFAAGRELHSALLQHGEGTWGLQRGNLAVLAPSATPDDAVVMAAKLRLACWGVLMIAGHDDTFVVPGGYMEL